MYYNRTLSNEFSDLLQTGGSLGWLTEFVKNHEELDLQTGRSSSKEWIAVYYGLTRSVIIRKLKNSMIFIDTDEAFHALSQGLYGRRKPTDNFKPELEEFLSVVAPYFSKNSKEDFIQTSFSRKYGICSKPDDEIVIIDRKPGKGFKNDDARSVLAGYIQQDYKNLQKRIPEVYLKEYSGDLKSNIKELEFMGLDKDGNILLMEFRHGSDFPGIYTGFIQLGLYYDLFSILSRPQLEFSVFDMLAQKQKIGLINAGWNKPSTFRRIIPVLVVCDNNEKSHSKARFNEILQYLRSKKNDSFLHGLKTYSYGPESGLTEW
jgi:hypothetical protein